MSTVQAQIRVVTYNCADPARPGIPALLQALGDQNRAGFARPIDILMLQEQGALTTDTQGFVDALNTIYGAGTYARGTFDGDGSGTQAVVYRTNTVQLIAETQASSTNAAAAASSALRYQFRPVGYDTNADFYVYNSHLKSSTGSTNVFRRAAEIAEIRTNADNLGQGARIIYLGDMNLYTSSEQGFINFTNTGNGQAFDPLNRMGSWNNNTNFVDVHTQSPVQTSHTYYGGQIGGGMDDRFDFQLVTGEVLDGRGFDYIANTYWAFGNTATHSINTSLSTGSLAALQAYLPGYTTEQAATVITSIMSSSDHLPVVSDYQLPARLGVTVESFSSRAIVGAQLSSNFGVSNSAPVAVTNGADRLEYTIAGSGDVTAGGSGTNFATQAASIYSFGVSTASVGAKSGSLSVTASSPQAANPSFTSEVNVNVLHHATASFASNSATSLLSLDFGTLDYGGSAAAQSLGIFNLAGASGAAWTAKLDLDSIMAALPTGIFSTTLSTFTDLTAGAAASAYSVSLAPNALGVFSGSYTLTLSDENIPGATNHTMTISLSGTVTGNISVGNGQTRTETNAIAGSGALTKAATGTLTITGANTYTGATAVQGGTLALAAGASISNSPTITVSSGATLDVSALTDDFAVTAGQTLAGSGSVVGDVALSGTVRPGNSPGTLTINGDLTWQPGGNYDWEIFDVDDGAGTGWDLIDVVGGSLLFDGLNPGAPFNINIYSLSGLPAIGGSLAAFSNASNYSWTILQSDSAISGFDASFFTLNTANFTAYNDLNSGLFSLEASGSDLRLIYTAAALGSPVPEPGTWAAAALLAAAACATRWRRKTAVESRNKAQATEGD